MLCGEGEASRGTGQAHTGNGPHGGQRPAVIHKG